MRSTLSSVLVAGFLATLLVPAAAEAQPREFDTPRWSVGLEGRVQETNAPLTGGEDFDLDELGLLPRFSLYLGDEWRFDGFASFGYGDFQGFTVDFEPGFRRYFFNSETGRFRLSAGASTSFRLFNHQEGFELTGFDADGKPQIEELGTKLLNVRVVPVEAEYWLNYRSALTFGADAGGQFYDSGFDYEGVGVFGGFRIRIK